MSIKIISETKNLYLNVQSLHTSIAFMKHFIPLSITNIIYNRVNYDAGYFNKLTLKDGCVYALINKKLDKKHELYRINVLTKDAMKLLKTATLKELFLIIRNEKKVILEHYRFIFKYNKTEDPICPTTDEMINEISKFLQSIQILACSKLKKFPNDVKYDLQLVINHSDSLDSNMKNFEISDAVVNPYDSTGTYGRIGSVSTGLHAIKLFAAFESIMFQASSNESDNSSESNNCIANAYEQTNKTIQQKAITPELCNSFSKNNTDLNNSKYKTDENNTKDPRNTLEVLEGDAGSTKQKSVNDQGSSIKSYWTGSCINIKCLCSISTILEALQHVKCTICGNSQHAACCGYNNSTDVPSPHICYYCRLTNDMINEDSILERYSGEEQRRIVAILRLFCVYCVTVDSCADGLLYQIPFIHQRSTIKKLLSTQIVLQDDNKRYIGNLSRLELILPKFFYIAPTIDKTRKHEHTSASNPKRLKVKYTGYRDRPAEERQHRFQNACREGHTEIAFSATGTNLQLVFTPPTNSYMTERECDFEKEPGKVHIKSGFIMNGVCVKWRGFIELERLEGIGCVEFCEERAAAEDALLREQIERYNQRLREFEDKQRGYRQDRQDTDMELRMANNIHGHHGHHGAISRCHGPQRHGLSLQVGLPLTPP